MEEVEKIPGTRSAHMDNPENHKVNKQTKRYIGSSDREIE